MNDEAKCPSPDTGATTPDAGDGCMDLPDRLLAPVLFGDVEIRIGDVICAPPIFSYHSGDSPPVIGVVIGARKYVSFSDLGGTGCGYATISFGILPMEEGVYCTTLLPSRLSESFRIHHIIPDIRHAIGAEQSRPSRPLTPEEEMRLTREAGYFLRSHTEFIPWPT